MDAEHADLWTLDSLNQLKRLSTLMKIEIIQEIPEELYEINYNYYEKSKEAQYD